MYLSRLMEHLETLAPISLAEDWDHVGLMLGHPSQEVSKILCALDVNEAVIEEAIQKGADCIVSHHPFLFKAVQSLDLDSPKGQAIEKLIKHNLSVYSMHTNYDAAPGGLNDYLAQCLSLNKVQVLARTKVEKQCKVAVYVPVTHAQAVKEVIQKENPCYMGKYRGCLFEAEGVGSFIPLEGSHPYCGQKGKIEEVKEVKISFMTEAREIPHLQKAIAKVHPYEEIAFDIYPLENMQKEYGIGRYGELETAVTLKTFIERLKKIFNIPYLRVTDLNERRIKRVAICSGAGADFLKEASQVADIYVTGDLKFHEAQEARERGICTIDIGHYASEHIAMKHIADYIAQMAPDCQSLVSEVNGETLFTL